LHTFTGDARQFHPSKSAVVDRFLHFKFVLFVDLVSALVANQLGHVSSFWDSG